MSAEVRVLARLCRASVTVLHSFDAVRGYDLAGPLEAPGGLESAPIPYVPSIAGLRKTRERELEEVVRREFADTNTMIVMEDGDPATVIRAIAERNAIDLVAMATSGSGPFRQLLLGSVTAKILHDVNCAVLTSAHELESGHAFDGRYRVIVGAAGLHPEAENIIRTAGALAELYGAKLSFVHLRQSHETAKSHLEIKADFCGVMQKLGIHAPVRTLDSSVPDGIRHAALEENADLVIVGRGRDRGVISHLWSHLYEIVRQSPCSVLSV
jgi:nucleotide-binding universal stress UspA family protein